MRRAATTTGCPTVEVGGSSASVVGTPWSVGAALLSELADAPVGRSVAECLSPPVGPPERPLRWAHAGSRCCSAAARRRPT